ncbi:helix-turn-helix transcriptional regulator [Marinicella litoralis]|uniref:AraC family transcriptional regulator n=1 Tax=Marinicella litoralis TaxID=644220 RepID=A0A4R6XWI3_9GAMM|nr:response regulator transcription factor [Marinicella litoralis]TDR22810.1 AraC family transcriptional regulator [Marinicella litoralis]
MSETLLFKTDLIEVGVFVVNPQDPCFFEAGFVESPIIVFPKNSIWIQHDGSDPFVADPTLVNFYNKGQTYKRYAIHQSGDYCHWFKISDELLSEAVASERHHFNAQNMPCPAPIFLQHLVILKQVMAEQQPDALTLEEQVLMLFHELLSQHKRQDCLFYKKQARHKRLIEAVKETLQSDLSVNLSLQQLSKLHNTSPFHLSRVFKSINGQGINQYRTQQRLRSLTLELQHNQMDLIDLACDYGFSSHSHMSTSFKQSFGITPSDFQKGIIF